MPAYELLAGSTYYVRGSPSSIAYLDSDGTLYVVDPGQGGGKVKSLSKLVKDLSPRRLVAVVTHYHSDHIEVLARGKPRFDEVLAPEADAPAVVDPVYRLGMTFGYPLEPGDVDSLGLPFPAPRVEVTGTYKPGGRVGPLESFPLPGHTPGQAGVATPDGVVFAADALFGSRVLERYLLPYHRDPCQALESLSSPRLAGAVVLVPAHGPVARGGEEARGLVELNRRALEEALGRVRAALHEAPGTVEDLLSRLVGDASGAGSPGLLMLVEQSLRGMLSCLARRGEARAEAGPRGVVWGPA